MLESSTLDSVKRYAPPSQRNRVLSRRKSGDRFERMNYSYGGDAEKNQLSHLRNTHVIDHGEAGNIQNENPYSGMIAIDGCCTSEAAQLLSERWAAAMHAFNDPSIDLSERPTMYSGNIGSAWGQLKLPQQVDFLTELRRAINNANSSATPIVPDHS